MSTKPHYSCCFVRHQNELFLVKKSHPDWQEGLLNGIGGRREDGETAEACANREWREETGLEAPPLRLFCALEDSQIIVHMFAGEYTHPVLLPDKNDLGEELVTRRLDTFGILGEPMVENLRWLVPMAFSDPYHMTAFVAARRRVWNTKIQAWEPDLREWRPDV